LATAAGLAALSQLTDSVFATLEDRVARFAAELEAALGRAGLSVRVPVCGTLCGLYLGDELPTDYDSAKRTDEKLYARLFHALLERGVAIAPGAYEVVMVGTAHTDEVLDRVVDIAAEAAQVIG
jgi:glutamate-1-semialdehyde 2,1-aminomutase